MGGGGGRYTMLLMAGEGEEEEKSLWNERYRLLSTSGYRFHTRAYGEPMD